jgi:RHH-type rel operon transcriptional repressor/antitoxin RelB
MVKTLNVRIPDEIGQRLENLAGKTKKPESCHIKKMLGIYLDEYEEACLAIERISDKNAKYYTSRKVKNLVEL